MRVLDPSQSFAWRCQIQFLLDRGLLHTNKFLNRCRQLLNLQDPLKRPMHSCHSSGPCRQGRFYDEIFHLHGEQVSDEATRVATGEAIATCRLAMRLNLLSLDKRLRQSRHTSHRLREADLRLELQSTIEAAKTSQTLRFCESSSSNLLRTLTSATPNLLRSEGVKPRTDRSFKISFSVVLIIPTSGFAYA